MWITDLPKSRANSKSSEGGILIALAEVGSPRMGSWTIQAETKSWVAARIHYFLLLTMGKCGQFCPAPVALIFTNLMDDTLNSEPK